MRLRVAGLWAGQEEKESRMTQVQSKDHASPRWWQAQGKDVSVKSPHWGDSRHASCPSGPSLHGPLGSVTGHCYLSPL